jgi:hypothetical protein
MELQGPNQSMNRWREYFSRPFPSVKGSSPYRFPGLIVHLPFIAAFLLLGLLLLNGSPALLSLLTVYAIVGLYLGRDLAILCHYMPLLTLIGMIGGVAGLAYLKQISAVFRSIPVQVGISPQALAIVVTLVIGVLFTLYVARQAKTEEANRKG